MPAMRRAALLALAVALALLLPGARASGSVTARYRYAAFGERFDLTGPPPDTRDPSFQNRNYVPLPEILVDLM